MRALLLAPPALFVAVQWSCAETRRSIGEECLKNDDCLSGVCVGRACDDQPSALERPLPPTPAPTPTGGGLDAGGDARADARADAPGSGG